MDELEKYVLLVASTIIKKDNIEVIERLKGGMSHLTYKIKFDDNFYVIRVVGKYGNYFIDRKDELEALENVHHSNITNRVYYINTQTGYKVSSFIEGIVLSESDPKPVLSKIVNTLKILHSSKKIKNDFNYLERIEEVQKELTTVSDLFNELFSNWIEIYNKKYRNDPKVLCHNDAQRSNMVLKDEKIYLLDFEFAANNSIYFEFASFGNISIDDSIMLMKEYLKTYTKEDIAHVKFYRAFQCLYWYLVATFKEEVGLSKILEFNFKELAENYLLQAKLFLSEINDD
ncbi:MAG: phosphotransferase family protein [Acholeplasmatales bacterium]|jgi:thiamine kinase-like enzyme|nr:phosphotransferase family protein [Acholeplasmatales bacterium]